MKKTRTAIVYVARNDVLLGATAGTTESRLADNVPGSELGSSAARNGTLGVLSSSGRLSVPISHDAIDGCKTEKDVRNLRKTQN